MSETTLNVRNVSANYGPLRVLNGIDLSCSLGDWFCLLGPNGSGKTTLLRCVGGQMVPGAGDIRIAGHSMLNAPEKAKRVLGYCHPPSQLPELLTGHQCLEVYAAAFDLPEVSGSVLQLAAKLKMAAVLNRTVYRYSLGMRQKLSLLLALTADPQLIVLDEAFNGLDPASAFVLKAELHERLAGRRCAVILATHALDIVLNHATRAALLLEGRLVNTWDHSQLSAMRTQDSTALETALATASATT
jgi:ABC-2 type transport system ATP-binding protein